MLELSGPSEVQVEVLLEEEKRCVVLTPSDLYLETLKHLKHFIILTVKNILFYKSMYMWSAVRGP